MDALRDINRTDGIGVVCNLHTLDTARNYCDRVIGMKQGQMVFDGTPAQLTDAIVRDIYGAAAGSDFDEGATSTSLRTEGRQPAMAEG